MTPIALTIAGSDSGGGAGIQADLKTFSALGVYGASVISAITAQNTLAVTAVHSVPTDIIAAQIKTVFDDLKINAVKIGMLASSEIIECVAAALEDVSAPVVLDPVMVSKSGDALLQDDAVETLCARLLPMAELVTPNLPEAARILGQKQAQNDAEIEAQGRAILAMGAKAVFMKGGHAAGDICTDFLITRGGCEAFSAPRQQTKNTHGTGCTLSSAITAELAKGADLTAAVAHAHAYLQGAISTADHLKIGQGHGPVHHFHALWRA